MLTGKQGQSLWTPSSSLWPMISASGKSAFRETSSVWRVSFWAGVRVSAGRALLVEAPLVADADGVGVVVAGVCADHLFGAAEVQLAVAGDVVVVAAALPAAGLVHLVELLHRDVLVGAARRAVNDN